VDLQEQTGGFGYLVSVAYDAADERGPWVRSLRLLAEEVLPAFVAAGVRDDAVAGVLA
jgi:hypothetical protein